jgi:hypothetical protein
MNNSADYQRLLMSCVQCLGNRVEPLLGEATPSLSLGRYCPTDHCGDRWCRAARDYADRRSRPLPQSRPSATQRRFGTALSTLDSTVNKVVRSTSVPTAERVCAPLMRSPSSVQVSACHRRSARAATRRRASPAVSTEFARPRRGRTIQPHGHRRRLDAPLQCV